MLTLTRYAKSLEDRRQRVIQLLETYINAVLQGQAPDFIAEIPVPGGRTIFVVPLLYMQAYVAISPKPPFHNAGWYADQWQYESSVRALMAALTWDGEGEPEGWYRHPATGRRRPEGDPAKEYVSL